MDEKLELMKICANCNHFFPLNEYNFEKGFCLQDKDLEPYLDAVLKMEDLSPILGLIENKLINNENDACKHFDPDDVMDGSILGPLGENPDPHEIPMKVFEKDPFTWLKVVPMAEHKKNLGSPSKSVREKAIKQIVNFSNLDNPEAEKILYEFYENLPPAESLEDTHLRAGILQKAYKLKGQKRFAKILIKELYRTKSNRTTRGLIIEILKTLSNIPLEYIEEDLENMLEDKRFSYRLKQKMRDILYRQYY